MGAKIDVVCNQITQTKEGYSINFSILDSVVGETDAARSMRAGNRSFDLVNRSKEVADQFEPGEEYTCEFKQKK